MLDDPTTTLNRLCNLEEVGWHWTRYLPGADRTMRRRGAEIVLLLEDMRRLQEEMEDIRKEIEDIRTTADAQEAEAMRAAKANWTTDDIHAALKSAIQDCANAQSNAGGRSRPIGDLRDRPAILSNRSLPPRPKSCMTKRRPTHATNAHRRR